jgi:hypothetical protein
LCGILKELNSCVPEIVTITSDETVRMFDPLSLVMEGFRK